MATVNQKTSDPKWWNNQHTSAWERVKGAFRRDWEQTKNDLSSSKGRDLDQDVDDTVKQAVGADPVPPMNARNPSSDRDDWDRYEAGHRYGFGARQQYSHEHADWDDRLEAKLRNEWGDLKTGRTWEEIKGAVRRGWDRGKSSLDN